MLRDLCGPARFTVILVTHDLREAVFLADTVYVHEQAPRPPRRPNGDRPAAPARPRGHLHDHFTDLVHELREQHRHGAEGGLTWPPTATAGSRRGRHRLLTRRSSSSGRSSAGVRDFGLHPARARCDRAVARRVLPARSLATPGTRCGRRSPASPSPSPWASARRDRRALALHLRRRSIRCWSGSTPSPRSAFVPILVVWFGIGAVPAILTAFLISLLPDRRQRGDRPRHARAGARGRAARARRDAAATSSQGRPAALDAVLLRVAQGGDHARLRRHRSSPRRWRRTTASAT